MITVEICSCGQPFATCPHLGIFDSSQYGATHEERLEAKRAHYAAAPERAHDREVLADVARRAGELRDRLRLADAAHDAGEIAEGFGAKLPGQHEIVDVADAVATFGPLGRMVPFIAKNPTAMVALEAMVEAARLLLRAIRGK